MTIPLIKTEEVKLKDTRPYYEKKLDYVKGENNKELTYVIVYEMCPGYAGTMRDWVWIPALTPEDALQKFNESRPNLVKAEICILYVARVIK